MRIVLASTNPGKLREIRAVIDEPGVAWVGLHELPRAIPEPIEDGDTFEANAVLKARYYAAASGLCCLADDSGLEVDALGGAPGVHSARYAGVTGPRDTVDPANNRLLLERLEGVPPHLRTARFVCAMALATPPDMPVPSGWMAFHAPCEVGYVLAVVRGTFEGRIIVPADAADPRQPHLGRGEHGFGYDPLFLPDAAPGRTSAELPPQQKNAISHRGDASRRMHDRIRQVLQLT
jgi:XTP/dITP diphosphohydrolase